MFKKQNFLFAVLIFSLVFTADIFARRGGGSFSSSRSSRSYSSPSRSASRSTSSWGRSKSSSIKRSNSTKTTMSRSKTDRALMKKNSTAGKKYGTRSKAAEAYKKENSSSFKNKFDSKPAKRPDYIPSSVNRGGATYNVTYNNGGYGYYNPTGIWTALAVNDMLVTNAMLQSRGYGQYNSTGQAVIVKQTSTTSSVISIICILFGVALIIVVVGAVSRNF